MPTVKQRMEAARILRGLSQKDLDQRGAELGLGKYELGRVERGELTFQATHRMVLCEVLQVPERWFTSDDVDEIVGLFDVSLEQALDQLLPDVAAAIRQQRRGPEDAGEERDPPGHQGTAG